MRGVTVASELEKLYPDSACSLDWGGGEAWKLMVMGRLSAQCTDARVNIVCEDLFAKYPTLSSLADAELSDITPSVHSLDRFQELEEITNNLTDLWKFGGRHEHYKCYSVFYNLLAHLEGLENQVYADKKNFHIISPL